MTLSGVAVDLEIHRIINIAFLRCSPKQGVSFSKNVGAPTFSLSFLQFPTLSPLAFQIICALFRSVSHVSTLSSGICALWRKNRGYRSWSYLATVRGPPGRFSHSPLIHNPVTPPSPILFPLLSQWTPVRGPTHTPCLSLSHALRYTSTNATRPARCLHETCTDH